MCIYTEYVYIGRKVEGKEEGCVVREGGGAMFVVCRVMRNAPGEARGRGRGKRGDQREGTGMEEGAEGNIRNALEAGIGTNSCKEREIYRL